VSLTPMSCDRAEYRARGIPDVIPLSSLGWQEFPLLAQLVEAEFQASQLLPASRADAYGPRGLKAL
jgi:hypothetical protein